MDLEEQDAIRRVAESGVREQMVVLLGTPTAGSTLMTALTLSQGDPSYAGPLAGIPLGLPSYHILEEGVRKAIPPDVYEREIGPLEFVLDKEGIVTALEKVRTETTSP
jgi:glycine/sarcosine/betaine reductase complex component A